MSQPEPESYSKYVNKSLYPTVDPKVATALSQSRINQLVAAQEESSLERRNHEEKVKVFERRQKLFRRVVELRRELIAAERDVAALNKQPEVKPLEKKRIEYAVEVVDGKIVRKEIELDGGKE